MRRNRLRTLAIVGISAVLATPAVTGQPLGGPAATSGGIASSKTPLTVDADNGIEWRRDEQVYIASGNARAVRGNVTLNADTLRAYYRDSGGAATDIYRVEAIGNVVITTPQQKVIGGHAVYDVDQAVAVLTGAPLTMTTNRGETVSARDSLEYWDARKLAVARGQAVALNPARGERATADILSARLSENAKTGETHVAAIEAFGNVRLTNPQSVATGGKGVYNLDTQMALLYGNVQVTHGLNHLEGDYGEVNFQTNVSRMMSAGSGDRAGSRVRGLLVPNPAKTAPLKP